MNLWGREHHIPEARIPSEYNDLLDHKKLIEWTKNRIQAYLADDATDLHRQLQQSTTRVEHAHSNNFVEGSIASMHKHVPVALVNNLSMEVLALHNRVNEDVVAHGDGWHVVADGASNDQRNICAITGELFALAWKDSVRRLSQITNPKPDTIKTVLNSAILRTRRALKEALDQLPQEQKNTYVQFDFSTTVEAVYYDTRYYKLYLLHIGDSRTYCVDKNKTITPLTQDHIQHSQLQKPPRLNSVLSPFYPPSTIDMSVHSLNPGDAIISCTDGVYKPLDARNALSVLTLSTAAEILKRTITIQTQDPYLDDASCAVMKIIK